ncbi:MAG: maltose/maltodextrin transport system permease protein [Bradyrhizobium sp.]|jgi:maltose/maltodextrin transport system permease protein
MVFDTIPVEIEEAAKGDVATPWQAFLYVLLPMAVPILMVVFLLAFIGAIIEYPVASVLLHEQNNLTLAVGSKLFLYEQKYLWGDFAAAAILSGLPITVVFLLAQKWMISGLTAGGVKG